MFLSSLANMPDRTREERKIEADPTYYKRTDPEGFGRLFQVMSPNASMKRLPRLLELTMGIFKCAVLNYTDVLFSADELGDVYVEGKMSKTLTGFDGHILAYAIRSRRGAAQTRVVAIESKRTQCSEPENRLFFIEIGLNGSGLSRSRSGNQCPRWEEVFPRDFIEASRTSNPCFLKIFSVSSQLIEVRSAPKPRMTATCREFSRCQMTLYRIRGVSFSIFNYTDGDNVFIDINFTLRFKASCLSILDPRTTSIMVFFLKGEQRTTCFEIDVGGKLVGRIFQFLEKKGDKLKCKSLSHATQDEILNYHTKNVFEKLISRGNIRAKLMTEKVLSQVLSSAVYDEAALFWSLPRELISIIGGYYRSLSKS